MIFQHTIDKVLSGQKTQTRRLVSVNDVELVRPLPQDKMFFQRGETFVAYPATETRPVTGIERNGRRWHYVGQEIAAQPGRGKPAAARIRITDIRREDVRHISVEDVWAEGFLSKFEFIQTWVSMHDKPVLRYPDWKLTSLSARPADRYDAWALTFELVTP